MEKIIFDTNSIRNIESKDFLGNRNELKKFEKVAEILIPEIVIEELKNQKIRHLNSKKQSFLDNPFHWLKKIDHKETKDFDIEAHIESLEIKETLKYSEIKLTDYSILEDIKKLALAYKPPFERITKEDKKNSDKGFKDAYIYFTILEYLQSTPDEVVFVCTIDGRLKEALEGHSNIIVVKDYEDFIKSSITRYYDEYFIEKLQTDIHSDISIDSIVNHWSSINENDVLLIDIGREQYVVEVDSGEIISNSKTEDYVIFKDKLINSESFAETHSSIDSLTPYMHFLSDNEIIQILQATINNGQIGSILSDNDVKQFISNLYTKKECILSPELRTEIASSLGIKVNKE